jgi:hypothetical protein
MVVMKADAFALLLNQAFARLPSEACKACRNGSTPDEDAPRRSSDCGRRHRPLRLRCQPDARAQATWRLRAHNGPGG